MIWPAYSKTSKGSMLLRNLNRVGLKGSRKEEMIAIGRENEKRAKTQLFLSKLMGNEEDVARSWPERSSKEKPTGCKKERGTASWER